MADIQHKDLSGGDLHPPKAHTLGSHSDVTVTGPQVDDAVGKRHNQEHGLASADDHTGLENAVDKRMVVVNGSGLPYVETRFDSDDVNTTIGQAHDRSHAINSTDDHTSSITEGNIIEADANGLPTDSWKAADDVVTGPSSSGDSYLAFFDGTSGKIIKDAGIAVSTDGTFASDDDWRVPTEKAAKTYVDTSISGFGDVSGPASATDSAVALFDGAGGKTLKDSTKTLPTGDIVGSSDSQTLTNKTIDAASNTISNIGNAEVSKTVITGQSADASPVGSTDYVLAYDADADALKKVLMDDLPGGSGETNTASNVGTAGVGVFKQKTGVDLEFKKINAASGSVLTVYDDTGNDEIDLDVSTMVGDSGAGGTKGLVPAPGAGDAAAGRFLKADGTFAVPAGGGDVTGPGSSTDSNLAAWNGTGGDTLKDSGKAYPSGDIVGTSDTQTLTNKTLTSPVINVTSDAKGDLYYRDASGNFVRLAIGSDNQVLTVATDVPAWETPSAGSGAQDLLNFARSMNATAGQFTLTCDGMYVGGSHYKSSINLTLDTANSAGALGIDTGSWATSTVYNIWLLYGTSGVTLVASLRANAFAAVTKPSGYDTAGRIVGGVITDSSTATDFIPCTWDGNVCTFTSTYKSLLEGSATTSEASFAMASQLPSTAKIWSGYAFKNNTGYVNYSPVTGGSGLFQVYFTGAGSVPVSSSVWGTCYYIANTTLTVALRCGNYTEKI